MTAARDIYIGSLFHAAKSDPRICLISVDMGAPTLDQWRAELPSQFISAGISEQNAINVAAGMAQSGRIPIVYFMAIWTARCFEQIRYSCAMPGLPVTIVGNGVGLGYAPAGPAHEPTEDLAYMRSLAGIEVWSPCSTDQVLGLALMTHEMPALRYLRLERAMPSNWEAGRLPGAEVGTDEKGFPRPIRSLGSSSTMIEVCILSYGFMLGRALNLAARLEACGIGASVVDIARLKPMPAEELARHCQAARLLVTLEEHFLDGGFGSAVAEYLADSNSPSRLLRLGLPNRYIFENGKRDQLLDASGLSIDEIEKSVIERLRPTA